MKKKASAAVDNLERGTAGGRREKKSGPNTNLLFQQERSRGQ